MRAFTAAVVISGLTLLPISLPAADKLTFDERVELDIVRA